MQKKKKRLTVGIDKIPVLSKMGRGVEIKTHGEHNFDTTCPDNNLLATKSIHSIIIQQRQYTDWSNLILQLNIKQLDGSAGTT